MSYETMMMIALDAGIIILLVIWLLVENAFDKISDTKAPESAVRAKP